MRVRSVPAVVVCFLLLPSVAFAARIHGSRRADVLVGTARVDAISALGGDDRVDVTGGARDRVACGPGVDAVVADASDRVGRDCELVTRRISADTLTRGPGQHLTEVEPSVAANGSTLVASFQVGRHSDGAADGIGWSRSLDGGRTWRYGILPGITQYSPAPGEAPRASDPAVAWDARHGTWLVATLIIGNTFTALGVSRSTDGVTWSMPVLAARASLGALAYDKEWIACDNAPTSPRFGNCYLPYTDFTTPRLAVQVSGDGGASWSAPITASADSGGDVEGALPVTQPDGAVTIVFTANEIGQYAVRSVDGGVTWARRVGISALTHHNVRGVRAPSLPTVTVDGDRIVVAWADCSLRAVCTGNDIVLTSSTDSVNWAPLRKIATTGFESIIPGLAADPALPGHLGLVTYVRPTDNCDLATCALGVAYTTSRDGGTTWTRARRLDARPSAYPWLAEAFGRFVGDYVGAAFSGGRFVPVFALAQPPTPGAYREHMFAAQLP